MSPSNHPKVGSDASSETSFFSANTVEPLELVVENMVCSGRVNGSYNIVGSERVEGWEKVERSEKVAGSEKVVGSEKVEDSKRVDGPEKVEGSAKIDEVSAIKDFSDGFVNLENPVCNASGQCTLRKRNKVTKIILLNCLISF